MLYDYVCMHVVCHVRVVDEHHRPILQSRNLARCTSLFGTCGMESELFVFTVGSIENNKAMAGMGRNKLHSSAQRH